MDQQKIDKTFKLLDQDSNERTLIPLYEAACSLGIAKLYHKNLDSVIKIIQNYRWYCPFDNSPTYFLNLDGFRLLHQFTIEYEKQIEENSALLEQKLTELIEDFSKKKA